MKWLRLTANAFYSVYCVISFCLVLFLLMFAYAAIYWMEDRQRTLNAYKANRFMCGWWFRCTGYRVEVTGWEAVDAKQTYVFAGNHCNMLDLPVTGFFLQHYYKSLAKAEFKYMPVLGFLFSIAAVFVDRKNAESRRKSTEKMISLLRAGMSFLIFPEGTRNKSAEVLLPFHKGAFKVAIAAQVPIVPFVFLGTKPLQPSNSYRFHRGLIRVVVLPAICTVGLTYNDVDALCEQVRQQMKQVLTNG